MTNRFEIRGWLYDGKSSTKTDTILVCDETGQLSFKVESASHLPSIKVTELKVSPRVGNTMRYLDLPDGVNFETAENDTVDAMLTCFRPDKSRGIVHRLESAQKVVVLSLLILVFAGWAFIQYGVPALSQRIAMALPDDTSSYLGSEMLSQLDKHFFTESKLSSEQQLEISQQFNELSEQYAQLPVLIEFRDSNALGANALALPNGTVVVTDDLVNLTDSPHELAIILLHEMGHVEHKHLLRRTIQSFTMTFLFMAVTGDVSSASSIVGSAPLIFIQSGYSQTMELEADAYALDYLKSNQLSSDYFVSVMRKLQASHSSYYYECLNACNTNQRECLGKAVDMLNAEDSDDPGIGSYLSTHPSISERIEKFTEQID